MYIEPGIASTGGVQRPGVLQSRTDRRSGGFSRNGEWKKPAKASTPVAWAGANWRLSTENAAAVCRGPGLCQSQHTAAVKPESRRCLPGLPRSKRGECRAGARRSQVQPGQGGHGGPPLQTWTWPCRIQPTTLTACRGPGRMDGKWGARPVLGWPNKQAPI